MRSTKSDPSPAKGKQETASKQVIDQASGYIRVKTRTLVMAALVFLCVILFILGYQVFHPQPRGMTVREVDAAMEKYFKKRASDPSIATTAYAKIRDSLVLIQVVSSGGKGGQQVSLGSGVVVQDTGAILTNLHVVRERGEIKVTFADGFETEAAIVAVQADNDLAVLQPRVVPDDLLPATLAGSGRLQIGDEVVAVGNPFGITGSASAGVVSGLDRNILDPRTGKYLTHLIQFDAAVNPGNSGGPLVDRNGEVVGIVTALLNPSGQNFFIGIGFAVTMEAASSALGIPPW
jgi:S1-C subfamily serine protease